MVIHLVTIYNDTGSGKLFIEENNALINDHFFGLSTSDNLLMFWKCYNTKKYE